MKISFLRHVLVGFSFLILPINTFAAVGKTDTSSYPRPETPPFFNSDHKTIDPTFGTTLLRVTGPIGSNAAYESTESQNIAPVQHFHDPWSVSGDHFLVWANRLSEGGSARIDLYELNRNDFTVSKVRSVATPVASMNYNRGVHFSHSNEWIVYAVDTSVIPNAIKRCNLNLSTTEEGLSPDTCETLLTDPAGIDQMTQSDDDTVFAYSTSDHLIHKVWDRSTDSFLITIDCSQWYSCDESQMSPDGKWLFIKGHQAQGDAKAWVYDITNPNNTRFYSAYTPDYFTGKHSGFGSKWVNETTQFSNYRLVVRNMETDTVGENPWLGGTPLFAFQHPVNSTGIAIHPSYSSANYIYGGFFRPAGLPTQWFPYMDEIVRIKDDGTEVMRLAHAWSNFYSNSYDEIPAYASPLGDFILFYSNWNGANNASRRDVFIVKTQDDATLDTVAPAAPNGLTVI